MTYYGLLLSYMAILFDPPPFNPGILGGGKARFFLRNISPNHVKYPPPHVFLGFQKRWGGLPDVRL